MRLMRREPVLTFVVRMHGPITSSSAAMYEVGAWPGACKRRDAAARWTQVNMWRARMGDSRWLESRERDHNVTWRPAKWLWMYS